MLLVVARRSCGGVAGRNGESASANLCRRIEQRAKGRKGGQSAGEFAGGSAGQNPGGAGICAIAQGGGERTPKSQKIKFRQLIKMCY